MRDEKLIIRCPYCGAEYVPSEIFYPEDFLPPLEAVKDAEGHIVGASGDAMNLAEEFVCEHCDHAFRAVATFSFAAEKVEEHDFGHDCEKPLYDNPRVELKED